MSVMHTLKPIVELLTHLRQWRGREDELSRMITAGPPPANVEPTATPEPTKAEEPPPKPEGEAETPAKRAS
jgi:hypothetical protein